MPKGRKRRKQGGYTFVEVAVAMSILAVGALSQASLTMSHYRQTHQNSEHRAVLDGARNQLELIKGTSFSQVFTTYAGAGSQFDVDGLQPATNDPDGRVGRILFPTVAGFLREDVTDERLGMPFDLDADGTVDGQPKDTSYYFLPVAIEIRWRGKLGDQVFRLATVLTNSES